LNSDCLNVVLLLGSNYRRSSNLKKSLNLIEKKYTILKKSRLYKSDDTTQKSKFYWNMALLLKMKKNDHLKHELVNIEKECGRSWNSMKKIIALDIDIALIYSIQSSSLECKVLTNNIDGSLHSLLSLKDILPGQPNIRNFLTDTREIGSQIRRRQINSVSIVELSSFHHHAP
tara:strand:- start:1465 stop:1983 length:519 start_codon:yes stop_codon:yes gene_type:complete